MTKWNHNIVERFSEQLILLNWNLHHYDNSLHVIDLLFSVHFAFEIQFKYSRIFRSTFQKKHQRKNQLSQLNETLNETVIGNTTNAEATRN